MIAFEIHLRGAFGNGVSKDELRAAVQIEAIYYSVPQGLECFRHAPKVLEEHDML